MAQVQEMACDGAVNGLSWSSSPEPPPFRSLDYGGSQIRPEATGYGTVIFAQAVLSDEASVWGVGLARSPCECWWSKRYR